MEGYSAVWAAIYLLFAYFALQREPAYGRVAKYLILYSISSVVWELLNAVRILRWLDILGPGFWNWQRYLGVLGLAILFLGISYEFLNGNERFKQWILISASWSILILILIAGPLSPSRIKTQWLDILIFSSILLGWVFVIMMTGLMAVQAYLNSSKPLHKNRILLWSAATFVITLGDMFIFASSGLIGSLLRIVGIFIIGYVVFFHNLIDLAGAIQKIPLIFYKSLIALVLYAILLSTNMPEIPNMNENVSAIFQYIFKALIIVIGLNPILGLLNQYIDRSTTSSNLAHRKVVREYNLAIGQIVDLRKLSMTAVDYLVNVLHIQHARLYLVDQAVEEGCFYLRPIVRPGEEFSGQAVPGKFSIRGALVHHFNVEQKPLTQYDIDFMPQYSQILEEERHWLSEQEMELYIPISTKTHWLGVFALGPKLSGDRYYPEELELLATLSDQTVIALQNARIFDDLRRTQRKLAQANQKLRDMDATKTAFISVVTHELRTPLANIGFSLQVLDMYGDANLKDEQKDQLDLLAAGVNQARAMIDNLITYASFLNEKVNLSIEILDFREILHEVLGFYKTRADQKSIRFFIDTPGDHFVVNCDKKLIDYAVRHLVDNAVKFTQKGSVWVSCWTDVDALCFNVKDTGIGIPSEQVSEIWEAFTQTSSDSLRRGVEGLGLGLALVKLIVIQHGGFVWVESQQGQGSFFGFQIPLAGPAKPLERERAKRLQQDALNRSLSN